MLAPATRAIRKTPELAGWAQMIPHVLALDPVATASKDLRNLACDAAWYLGKRGDAQASHDLASRLYAHWRTGSAPTIPTRSMRHTIFNSPLANWGSTRRQGN